MLWHCIFQKAVLSKDKINVSLEVITLLQSDIKNLKTAAGGLFSYNVPFIAYYSGHFTYLTS